MNQLPDKNKDPLNKLLNEKMLEQPSADFTASVMNKLGIAPAPAVKYEPIITRTGWIVIGGIISIILFLALSGSPGTNSSAISLVAQSTLQQGTSFVSQLFSGSIIVLLAVGSIAVFLLFSAESAYRQSRLKAG